MRFSIGMAIMAVMYFGLGVWGFLDPVGIGAKIGLTVGLEDGVNEMRAVYGGFMMGIGIFFGLATVNSSLRKPAWLFIAISMGGLVLGRLGSFILDGPADFYHQAVWAVEIVCTLGASYAYWQIARVGSTHDQHETP